MTKCSTEQLSFSYLKRRKLTVDFQGGEITSDVGVLLLRQADDCLGLSKGISPCIVDRRDARYVDHDQQDVLR